MNYDVVIIGGGPAGSVAALRLLDRGLTPVIIERETFPRYHVGESMTGECGQLVRELGFENEMNDAGHTIKSGTHVHGPTGDTDWWVPVMAQDPDGTRRHQTTWQVTRSRFDRMLLDAAVERGAHLVDGRASSVVVDDDDRLAGVTVDLRDGGSESFPADLTLDCSGMASFLANQKVTGPKYLGSYDKQIAIFSQVTDFARDRGPTPDTQPGNTHIFYSSKYHWSWGIPIDDELTSVGIVIPAEYFRNKGESREEFLRRELRELNPALAERIEDDELQEPARVVPNYSFQVRRFAGPGYICVGDAHRFVDPIFSLGLNVAIKEAHLAVDAGVSYLEGEGRGEPDPFHAHMVRAESGIDIIEDLVDTFWENPLAFSVMAHRKFRDGVIDVFGGRMYDDHPAPRDDLDAAINAFRKLLGRDRTYEEDGLYSVPIGSRYHPERAPLWDSRLKTVESTETWLSTV